MTPGRPQRATRAAVWARCKCFILVALLLLLEAGCTPDREASGDPPAGLKNSLPAAYVEPRVASDAPVDWAEHIAPIVFRHCVHCHRDGSMAPFSLERSESAVRFASALADAVTNRSMPPWLPSPEGLPLDGRRGLTENEIDLIARWAEAPAVSREVTPPPAPPSGWQLGTPDLIVELAEAYELDAEGPDIIRNFVLPIPGAAGRKVRAVELDPGNRRVVHHANVLADTRGRARQLDLEDPRPGYAGMVAAVAPGGHFLGWTPGKQPRELPAGTAWRVQEGTDLVLQLHLMPAGTPQSVRPRVGLFFTEEAPRREPVVLHLGSTDIDLSPGSQGTAVRDSWEVPYGFRLVAAYPHAHYLGASVRVWADVPGQGETVLLDIPRWDFFWQDEYVFESEREFPAQTTLHLRVTYDNSASNARNPFDPPRRVRWGPSSRDEMCDVWLTVFPLEEPELPLLRAASSRRSLSLSRDGIEARAGELGTSRAWASLARLDLELGSFRQAQAGFVRALETTRRDAPAADPAGEQLHRAQLQHDLALTQIGQRRYREAATTLQGALDLLRDRETAPDLSASALANLGGAQLVLGQNDEAVRSFEEALGLTPDDPVTRTQLALARTRQGNFPAAEAQYRRALAAAPDHAGAHAGLGALLARQGDAAGGRRLLLRALELDPLLAEAHKNLATLAAMQNDLVTARAQLERALAIDGEDPTAHHLLGMTAMQQNDPAAARASFERALELDPRHPDALRDLATLHTLEGRSTEALTRWRQAREVLPDDPEVVAGLADALVRTGRVREAASLVRDANARMASPLLQDLERQIDALLQR